VGLSHEDEMSNVDKMRRRRMVLTLRNFMLMQASWMKLIAVEVGGSQ
jgi:hypothetical protein